MHPDDRKNMIYFGLGTIGRDMFYALEANALIYYLSNVLNLPQSIFLATSMVFTVLRVFDALNDPLMGLIIDNGRWKKSKFKPPLMIGAVVGGLCYMLFFTDFGFRDSRFVIIFAIAYLLWDIFYGLNDIAYWSMLPALSFEQKTREKMGAFARICANIGLFAIMVGWQPLTKSLGNDSRAWMIVAGGCTIAMLFFQLFTVFGVKEKQIAQDEEKTTLAGLWHVLTGNDQLMWTTLSMSLFTVGYVTTTTLSVYYMQYVYGDIDMYPVLALVVGISQLLALAIFPLVSKSRNRREFYALATVIVLIGYFIFFLADFQIPGMEGINLHLIMIVLAALFLFIGEAFIQLLMLMFLADTVEYGQLKLGKRNESITFSVQPLINKMGGALAMGITSICLLLSGIKEQEEAAQVISAEGKVTVKVFMIVLPLILILLGYWIYRKKYRISEEKYEEIVAELRAKGQLLEE